MDKNVGQPFWINQKSVLQFGQSLHDRENLAVKPHNKDPQEPRGESERQSDNQSQSHK